MKTNELNKRDLENATKMYIEDRVDLAWNCSLEEYVEHYLKRCECCGELVREDLVEMKNWDGRMLKVCSECCYEMSNEIEEFEDQHSEYQDYLLMEEFR